MWQFHPLKIAPSTWTTESWHQILPLPKLKYRKKYCWLYCSCTTTSVELDHLFDKTFSQIAELKLFSLFSRYFNLNNLTTYVHELTLHLMVWVQLSSLHERMQNCPQSLNRPLAHWMRQLSKWSDPSSLRIQIFQSEPCKLKFYKCFKMWIVILSYWGGRVQ